MPWCYRVSCKIQIFSQNQLKRKCFYTLKWFGKLSTLKEQVDIVVCCCVSNIGLVKYTFISMDQISLKSDVMVACAIFDHVGPSYSSQGSSVPLHLHQESITLYWQGGTWGKGRRNEETWSELARARADLCSLLTPGPWFIFSWTRFDAVHSKVLFPKTSTGICQWICMCEKWINRFRSTWTQHGTSETTLTKKPKQTKIQTLDLSKLKPKCKKEPVLLIY